MTDKIKDSSNLAEAYAQGINTTAQGTVIRMGNYLIMPDGTSINCVGMFGYSSDGTVYTKIGDIIIVDQTMTQRNKANELLPEPTLSLG